MTIRTATACFLGLAFLAGAGQGAAQKDLPRIPNPEALAIEMAKALVSDDRKRFTALAATREEMDWEGASETMSAPTGESLCARHELLEPGIRSERSEGGVDREPSWRQHARNLQEGL
jgi:hypothetical protein